MSRLRGLRIDPYFVAGILSAIAIGVFLHLRRAPAAAETPRPDLTEIPAAVEAHPAFAAGLARGSPAAPVHVIEFTDYECPACAAAHLSLESTLREHVAAGRVHHTVHDLPLPGHPAAVPAALVASCAADADAGLFWTLRGRIFAGRDAWSEAYPPEDALLALAADAGADSTRARRCMRERGGERAARLRDFRETAMRAGMTYTPVWAVNGRIVPWPRVGDEVARALEEAER